MTQVLHISPHVGGGVGKFLSGIVDYSLKSNSEFQHTIISLEKNKKIYFKNKIKHNIIEQPDKDEFIKLINNADIIELEWWNHPATIKYLSNINQNMRLLTISHNSGLFSYNIKEPGKLPPIIPKKLILASQFFILTNECSLECKDIKELLNESPIYQDRDIRGRLGIVYSSGGFKEFPDPNLRNSIRIQIAETIFRLFIPGYVHKYPKIPKNLSVGYFGTINFAKLHPDFIKFIYQARKNLCSVKMIGECSKDIQDQLRQQCDKIGYRGTLQFIGYAPESKLISELGSINVLAYILNPEHYGTTENSLLEAMSMGIVPIVLNNPAEIQLVDSFNTGIIIRTPEEFREAISYLNENPDKRKELGINAAKIVREKFSLKNTVEGLNYFYRKLIKIDKKIINFDEILS